MSDHKIEAIQRTLALLARSLGAPLSCEEVGLMHKWEPKAKGGEQWCVYCTERRAGDE